MTKDKTHKLTCKFIKYDKYKNKIFLIDDESNQEEYLKLRKYEKYLRTINEDDTNNPIWLEKKKKFGTIRFKKTTNEKLSIGAIYDVYFNLYQIKVKGKKFHNLVIENVKLIKARDDGIKIDMNEDIEISSDEEEE